MSTPEHTLDATLHAIVPLIGRAAVIGVGAYLLLGAIVGALVIVAGVGRFDSAARASKRSLRLLWWPGAAALWPVLLVKWLRAARHTADTAHTKGAH